MLHQLRIVDCELNCSKASQTDQVMTNFIVVIVLLISLTIVFKVKSNDKHVMSAEEKCKCISISSLGHGCRMAVDMISSSLLLLQT